MINGRPLSDKTISKMVLDNDVNALAAAYRELSGAWGYEFSRTLALVLKARDLRVVTDLLNEALRDLLYKPPHRSKAGNVEQKIRAAITAYDALGRT